MPSLEVLVAILGIAMTVITGMGGVVYKLLREEAKDHSELIKGKADTDHVKDMDVRWQHELSSVRTENEKLITKLEERHNREVDQLATRLSDQIRNSENNVLSQIRLMVEALKK